MHYTAFYRIFSRKKKEIDWQYPYTSCLAIKANKPTNKKSANRNCIMKRYKSEREKKEEKKKKEEKQNKKKQKKEKKNEQQIATLCCLNTQL